DQSGDDGLELLRSSPVPAPGGRDQLDAELRYDVRHAHYGALGTSLDRGRGELGVAGKDREPLRGPGQERGDAVEGTPGVLQSCQDPVPRERVDQGGRKSVADQRRDV